MTYKLLALVSVVLGGFAVVLLGSHWRILCAAVWIGAELSSDSQVAA